MDISTKTNIGQEFKIEHIGGIVINPDAILRDNVTLLNNVLIRIEKELKELVI